MLLKKKNVNKEMVSGCNAQSSYAYVFREPDYLKKKIRNVEIKTISKKKYVFLRTNLYSSFDVNISCSFKKKKISNRIFKI